MWDGDGDEDGYRMGTGDLSGRGKLLMVMLVWTALGKKGLQCPAPQGRSCRGQQETKPG